MREASKLERTSLGLNPKSKYYIIPEGEKTEIQYFLGIRDNAREININSLIEVIPIENDEEELGQSHPIRKITNFNEDIKNNKFLYDNEIDKVCFVIDRDPQNFSEHQYDDFLQMCKEYTYKVYVSNPTFELFLLMHDDKIFDIDRIAMLENRKVSNSKRFLELKLSEIFGCNKKNINFEKFKPNIKKAINNEKQFEENLMDLKNNLGSNVGILLDEMIEN
ncbi:MAG: RloB domain-containing protein [Clostridia bacterium]|nr:RloB domain-containing protein [Clostridia bacterium]